MEDILVLLENYKYLALVLVALRRPWVQSELNRMFARELISLDHPNGLSEMSTGVHIKRLEPLSRSSIAKFSKR